jgi:hypothetical protein
VGCQAAADYGDDSVYNLTLDYKAGFDFLMAWQSLWQSGAEECMSDNRLETVNFKIEGVPSPRPVGWQNGALSDRQSCKQLEDGYPYHG